MKTVDFLFAQIGAPEGGRKTLGFISHELSPVP